jgi:hypothetical protein
MEFSITWSPRSLKTTLKQLHDNLNQLTAEIDVLIVAAGHKFSTRSYASGEPKPGPETQRE